MKTSRLALVVLAVGLLCVGNAGCSNNSINTGSTPTIRASQQNKIIKADERIYITDIMSFADETWCDVTNSIGLADKRIYITDIMSFADKTIYIWDDALRKRIIRSN